MRDRVSVFYETRANLEAPLRSWVVACNLGKHLKGLRWKTSFEATCEARDKVSGVFKDDPHHLIAGPHT